MATSLTPMFTKLNGRETYNNWAFAMQAYLEHEDLWNCVLGTDDTADAAVKAKRDIRAKSKLVMMVNECNYIHIRNVSSAKEVWQKLADAFEDTGLSRRVGLMRKMLLTKLEDCHSMEEYVTTILSTSQMLNDIKFEVSPEWIGTFLLAGLPEMYKPMIMAIENSGVDVTGDYVKSKLLQEVKCESKSNGSMALYSATNKKKQKHKHQLYCYNCNKPGHFSNKCTQQSGNKTKLKMFKLNQKVHCCQLLQ